MVSSGMDVIAPGLSHIRIHTNCRTNSRLINIELARSLHTPGPIYYSKQTLARTFVNTRTHESVHESSRQNDDGSFEARRAERRDACGRTRRKSGEHKSFPFFWCVFVRVHCPPPIRTVRVEVIWSLCWGPY